MDFNKRYSDEILIVSSMIESVSVRTSSLIIKGEWYRLTDKTQGAKKINLIRPGLNVEITYKVFRRPGIEINYIQSINLIPALTRQVTSSTSSIASRERRMISNARLTGFSITGPVTNFLSIRNTRSLRLRRGTYFIRSGSSPKS